MDFEKDHQQENNDLQSVQNRGWQDGSGSGNPPTQNNNNVSPLPNDVNPVKENIPKMTEEEQIAQNKWRNSPEMNQGLLEILPKGNNQSDPQSTPLNLDQLRTEWQGGQDPSNPTQSPVIAFYKEIQGMTDDELNEKIASGFDIVSNVASTADTVTGMLSSAKPGDEKLAKASLVTGSVASGLAALKDGVMAIKHIYDAFKDAEKGSSKQDKAEATMQIVQELISAASGTVSALKSVLELFEKASGGLSAAIPGLGLALNAVNIAIDVYELMKAKASEEFVEHELETNEWEGMLTSNKGGKRKQAKEKRQAQDDYIAKFEGEITTMTQQEQTLLQQKKTQEADPEQQEELAKTNLELQGLQQKLALTRHNLEELKENQALTNLAQINKDRQKDLGADIGIELVDLIGNVLALVPEPSAQIASITLKAVASGAAFFKKVGGFVVQKMRDEAAENPKSILNGFVDSTRSTDKEDARKKESARYIFNKISTCDLTDGRAVNAVNQFIEAAGMSPSELSRIHKENGMAKAIQALVNAQGE